MTDALATTDTATKATSEARSATNVTVTTRQKLRARQHDVNLSRSAAPT